MSYSYRIFPGQNLVLVVATGRVAGDDLIAETERMFEESGWQPTIDQVCDFRDVQRVAFTLDDMKRLLDLERRYDYKIGAGRQALVVSSELHESLCTLYVAMARLRRRPQQIRVFRAMDDALAWLGRPALPRVEGRDVEDGERSAA